MSDAETLRRYVDFWQRMESACCVPDIVHIPRYRNRWRYCQVRAQVAWCRLNTLVSEQAWANFRRLGV